MSDPETPPEPQPEPAPEPPAQPEVQEQAQVEVTYAGDPVNQFGTLSDDGLEVVTLVHVRDDEVEVVEEQPA